MDLAFGDTWTSFSYVGHFHNVSREISVPFQDSNISTRTDEGNSIALTEVVNRKTLLKMVKKRETIIK